MKSLKYYFLNPKDFFIPIMMRTAYYWPDVLYLKIMFYLCFGQKLNLKNPKTFNEKLNWLKLNDIHPEYSCLVDKYLVKQYVKEKLESGENIIKTIGVWNTFDEIDFSILPNKFVLKTTNGGGSSSVVICRDKDSFDREIARKKLKLKNSRKGYAWTREYPYYNVKPMIIAEEYIEAPNNELSDYKIFCFNGEPKFLFVGSERQKVGTDVKFDFFDTEFKHLPIKNGHSNAQIAPGKPDNFDKMLDIARKLSQNIPHVRVDLYNVNGKILFGELTFFHFGGFVPFEPAEWDIKFGEYLKLPFSK